MKGARMEEWEPRWNSTWALKNESWSLMGFEEARALTEGERGREGGGKEGEAFGLV